MRNTRFILSLSFLIVLLLISNKTYAQYPTYSPALSSNPNDSGKVEIIHADVADFTMVNNELAKKLKGKVVLKHKDATMWCDSAILDNYDNIFARGNVKIRQGDSLSIFADSTRYFGLIRNADLFGDVILVNNEKKLFTTKLNYDFNSKVATYNTKSTLADARTQMTSRRGQYFVNANQAHFKDQVLVVDKDFDLKTDTLRFDTKLNIAYFLAPTLIYMKDTTQFYTEGGYYDLQKDDAAFTKTPQYKKRDQVATSDTMYYNGKTKIATLIGNAFSRDSIREATANTIRINRETDESWLEGKAHYKDDKQDVVSDTIRVNTKTKTYTTVGRSDIINGSQRLQADNVNFKDSVGIAKGNVIWRDTSAKQTIVCEDMYYDQRNDSIRVKGGRPILTTLVDNDTLWLRADTIISFKPNPKDSIKTILAFYKVRIYKSNFQSICDSLSYSEKDSIFRLFRNPVLWSDTSQMTADTMRILLKDKKIERVFMRNNAMIVNTRDDIYYNQIKGKDITAFFESDEIRRMLTEGNAESVYYALDAANAYINVNKVECSEMLMYFGNNKVEKIKFFNQPKAKSLPMRTTDHKEIQLKGFKWIVKERPFSLKDL